MYVAEFSLHAKPGHYREVADLYSAFAADYLSTHAELLSVTIVGDDGSGLVRGLGIWESKNAADSVNSDPEFAAFNDAIGPLLAEPADRLELELLHLFTRMDPSD